jgi:hypothetical protein
MKTLPYGMEREVSQVKMNEFKYNPDADITEPFGRPGCYLKATKPCGMCPWKTDCVNAEGRS